MSDPTEHGFEETIAAWRADADALERQGHPHRAEALRRRADEAESALRNWWKAPLTMEQAAKWTGYSEGHLRRLVKEGALPNVGEGHRILVRRCDLPRKAGQGVVDQRDPVPLVSRTQMARSVVEST